MSIHMFPEKKPLLMSATLSNEKKERLLTRRDLSNAVSIPNTELASFFLRMADLCDSTLGVGFENVSSDFRTGWLLLPVTSNDLYAHSLSAETALPRPNSDDIRQFGAVSVNFFRLEIRRAGELVQLTALEFKVLRFFMENPHRVIGRQELLDKVWGYNCYPVTRTVDNQILRLRQKLEAEPARPVHFQTVHGVGYKFR